MRARLKETPIQEPLTARLKRPTTGQVEVYWLGQAGFVIDIAGMRLVIDPYLSDSLAAKYRNTARPHVRMMPPPVLPDEVLHVDLVLCTHAHTDHMDPGTLPLLLSANPRARLIAPRAVAAQAMERSGAQGDRLILARASEPISPPLDIEIMPTRAAHETLETDTDGNHRFLGYAIRTEGTCIWHSGDCIPFDGLEDEVRRLRPDVALLPVNGRRAELSQNGVPGNFSLHEAIAVTRYVGATDLIAHHYGLFDFNTEQPEIIDAEIATTTGIGLHRAKTDILYTLQKS
ncbi:MULTISPECIES: MBL fold metallo-hydrolase [unclassified Rhizobium]|uniref:MBL fold metallo-hydrolase n=1 Tax=unclassified Rhizobium TaxID=2613769 RepID=UPI001ADAD98B|nr:MULTISPECIES: MBL fold metallo-hydrolase [unclassified Rhizobium]MBO9124022.1 MBL fold metallo-hydrolase [Rhizobium sp. 16-488-2b]MBO9174554.1 MBL fold metallo-hydrolase [Rhizobium sp. 16-488-2a]